MMPKLDGLALLKEMQARGVSTECIIVTGQATVDSAVQAMRQGAYDYIEKPLNAEKLNRLKALIPKALDKFNDRQKIKELASTIEGLTHEFDRRWACAHYQYSLAQSGVAQQPVNEHTPAIMRASASAIAKSGTQLPYRTTPMPSIFC